MGYALFGVDVIRFWPSGSLLLIEGWWGTKGREEAVRRARPDFFCYNEFSSCDWRAFSVSGLGLLVKIVRIVVSMYAPQ